MPTKKVADAIEVRIAIGNNYEHIKFTKYAEQNIEFSNDEERVSEENRIHNELVTSLISQMRELPSKLGKSSEASAVQVLEESIKSTIPRWLEEEEVPNLAETNMAKVSHDRAVDEQKDNRNKQEDHAKEINEIIAEPTVEKEEEPKETETEVSDELEDILNDTVEAEETKKEEAVTVPQSDDSEVGDLIFDDDDLFED